jgi:BRCA2, oligonucleotide/oligosaccharide-binding, domain 1/BRCA2, helical/BRCA2 repeat
MDFSETTVSKTNKSLDSPFLSTFGFKTGSNNPFNVSKEALLKAQHLFDSPSQMSMCEDKEKPTEIIEKKPVNTNIRSIRSEVLKNNKTESCNPSIYNKLFTENNQISFNPVKRRSESPVFSSKSLLRKQNIVDSVSLHEINCFKPLKGFYNSCGLLVNAENAGDFVFKCYCYTNGCGCSKNGMSWEDFYDQLIEQGYKCSKEWVKHHYRFVIWKYASYERRIQACKGIFTVIKVLDSLKKRFNTEIIENKRSILKKIIEGDEVSTKRMVLCIGCIKYLGSQYLIELTDGWHSCWTEISNENLFFPLLQRKKIYEGLKIEVIGCTMVENKLILAYNSTKRASWHRKLGEVSNPYPFPISISSIKESGGLIGNVTGYISRIYPMLYIEASGLKNKYTVSDPTGCFFECTVKDGLVDYSNNKASSALIRIKHQALDIQQNMKLGGLVRFYYLLPEKPKNFKRVLLFNYKSKIAFAKKERKDLVKPRKLVDNKTKAMKEVDAVGVVISLQRTQSGEVASLNLAGVHSDIKINIHNPSLLGRNLSAVEPSTLKSMKIVLFLNLIVENKKSNIIEVKTSNYTEIVHSDFPGYVLQHISVLKDLNLNTLLSHRQECDHFGCVCGFE